MKQSPSFCSPHGLHQTTAYKHVAHGIVFDKLRAVYCDPRREFYFFSSNKCPESGKEHLLILPR
jgi:hypothetical protein